MPGKYDKVRTQNTPFDKRVKLTKEQKDRIAELSKQGLSQRTLAKMFNVSRRMIQFVIDPLKAERNSQLRKNKPKEVLRYYNRNHAKAMATARAYRKSLVEKKLIKLEEK